MGNRKTKSTFSAFLSYLIPSMLSMALMAAYTFTDTFVVGQKLGSVALGAMGICTPIITITYALGFLFGMGGGALYSIEMGRKNTKQANGIFSTSLLMLLVLGVILAVLGNIFAELFARFLGADDVNIAYVMPYLRCVVTYIPGFMYDVFIMSYIKNDGHPKTAMAAVVIGTGLNIVLDLLFVFVFDWGMFGAAIATCIGSFVGLAINTGYALIKKLNILFRVKNIVRSEMLRIVKSGISVFILESSSGIVTFVFINRAVSLYGTLGSSVYTIIMNWTLICFNLIMGIAQSVQPLISVSFGAGDVKKVGTYRKYALTTAVLFGVVFILIGYGFTPQLVSVFATDSEELIRLTISSFRLYLPAYLLMGVGICIGIYFQSIEASMKSLLIMSLRGIILPVVGAVCLTGLFGGMGLWITVPLAELLTGIIAAVLLVKSEKQHAANAKVPAETVREHNLHTETTQPVIIAISREFGSGGRAIGHIIGEKMGVPVYDKSIGELTQTESGYNSDVIDTMEDTENGGFAYGLYANNHYVPIRNKIFQAQSSVLLSLADKGSCVVIGRCADYVLRDKFKVVSVFIHAPLEMRVQRVMEYDKCSYKEAIRKIRESDKAREGYHDFYTDIKWGRSQSYDLTVDSSMGFEKAANLIMLLAEGKVQE
ncbi:MAG: cytidylate kinase family protein [Tannerellaceae bacterium]|nr:cytidylate kinase family protein [Tannerellaceae bacterium]